MPDRKCSILVVCRKYTSACSSQAKYFIYPPIFEGEFYVKKKLAATLKAAEEGHVVSNEEVKKRLLPK